MKKELLFLVNPKAGKAEIKNSLMDIINRFVQNDWKVVVQTTQYAGEVTDIIREEACNYEMIVCSGGDGTLNEAVCGLMQTDCKPQLGYIPSGTTNDFAVSLDLPREVHYATEAIVGGVPFSCDVGRFNDKHFVYVAAFGLFTDVSYSTPQPTKNMLGRVAYLMEGIKSLTDIKTHQLTIEQNGETITGEFLFGMVSNSISVGGFKMGISADVSMNDGLLEVLLVKKPRNLAELQGAIAALLRNDLNNPCLYSFRTSDLRIFSSEDVSWTLDGEFGGELRDVQISVIPQAYSIMVPSKEVNRAKCEAEINRVAERL
ncbi:MAG: YegS/Rv2252/BmrU family lipid kinase [Peptococcaceae bacterium]|nr:YegS/Rv2252/BmrU family lipid kinase [Peptococcaceae bacterium]